MRGEREEGEKEGDGEEGKRTGKKKFSFASII